MQNSIELFCLQLCISLYYYKLLGKKLFWSSVILLTLSSSIMGKGGSREAFVLLHKRCHSWDGWNTFFALFLPRNYGDISFMMSKC